MFMKDESGVGSDWRMILWLIRENLRKNRGEREEFLGVNGGLEERGRKRKMK